jgi:hypothetical protein
MGDVLSAHDLRSGHTDLHFMHNIIQEITKPHSTVGLDLRNQNEKKLTDMLKRLITSIRTSTEMHLI